MSLFTSIRSVAVLGSWLMAALAGPGPDSPFQPVACMFELPLGTTEGEDVSCGYLTVPSNHNFPAGPKLKLAVAIFNHRGTSPQSEPLVMLQGGPGGSALDAFPGFIQDSVLLEQFDIILLEQRGTLFSKPSLDCEETRQYSIDLLDKDFPPEQQDQLWQEALSQCRARLAAQGIDLSDFDSLENANDIEDLRLALGYERIDLYGVSYGSLLALHYLDLFPNSLRAVILDGVVPPQLNYINSNVLDQDRVFKALFSACRASDVCSASYPELEDAFFQVVDGLEKSPARVVLQDPETGKRYDALVDGETFYWGIYRIFYSTEFIPAIPYVIYRARARNFDGFTTLLGFIVFDKSLNYATYYSVNCAEEGDISPEKLDLTGANPKIVELNRGDYESFLESCQAWAVESLGPREGEAVHSDVPVLLLSGGFDPVTPEGNAALAAATLSNSYAYTFPTGGHGQAFSNPCADHIMRAFLERPTVAPDSACISEYAQVAFWRKGAVISVPLFARALILEKGLIWPAGLVAIFGPGMVSALFILPLVWFIKLFLPGRREAAAPDISSGSIPEEQSMFEAVLRSEQIPRLAGPAAILNGVVVSVFWISLTSIFIYMIFKEDMMVVWGVASRLRPLFLLPPLSFFLTVFACWATISGWKSVQWSVWRKIYFGLLSLSALVCTAVAFHLGLMLLFFK